MTTKEKAMAMVQAYNLMRIKHLGQFTTKEFVLWSKEQGLTISGAWLAALNATVFKHGKVFTETPIDWKELCSALNKYKELGRKYAATKKNKQQPVITKNNMTCSLNLKVKYV